jgi:PAS domain S-box-containing protein
LKLFKAMDTATARTADAALYGRGPFVAALTRWTSVVLAVLTVLFVWHSPLVRPWPAMAVGVAYAVFNLGSQLWVRRHPPARRLKTLHDVVDVIAVGAGAYFTGGLRGPLWLFLYPQVVAVSVRRGLGYGFPFGLLAAAVVTALGQLADHPLAMFHALTLLFCAFAAGSTGSYLRATRRRQEEALTRLTASQERYRTLLEGIQDGVAIVQRGRVVYANSSLAALTGCAADALRGRAFHELAPEADRAELLRRYEEWEGREGLSGALEVRLLSAGGAIHTTSVRAGAVTLEGGRGIITTVRDITREREMEDAVKAHAERLQSLVAIGQGVVERLELRELLPLITRSVNRVMGTRHCVLFLRDGDRLKVAAQEGMEDEFVRAFDGLRVGQSLSGWIISQGQALAITDLLRDPRLLFGPAVERFQYRSFLGVPLRRADEILGTLEVVTKEERRFSLDEQAVMSAFADQAAVALDNARLFEQAHRHLSEVVEANRRLEDLNRLRQQYLRNVSHEFRTPLTVIKGYAEFLRDGPPEGESLEEVLRVMAESCDRLIEMVDTLIDVSRIEREEAQRLLQIQALDLREVTAASVEVLRLAAQKKNVAVHLDFPDAGLGLEGDGNLLHQVVRKLLDNAVKYSPAGARVLVRGRAEGDDVALEVEDFGVGIAPEHLPRIFEKFYMVDGGISRRVGGTGVGLYLVREIVRLHHGSVAVRSNPGQGSVFSVRLPRRYPGSPGPAAPA